MDIDDAMDLARAGDDEVELALCAEVKRLRAERDALRELLSDALEYYVRIQYFSHEDVESHKDFRKRCTAALRVGEE